MSLSRLEDGLSGVPSRALLKALPHLSQTNARGGDLFKKQKTVGNSFSRSATNNYHCPRPKASSFLLSQAHTQGGLPPARPGATVRAPPCAPAPPQGPLPTRSPRPPPLPLSTPPLPLSDPDPLPLRTLARPRPRPPPGPLPLPPGPRPRAAAGAEGRRTFHPERRQRMAGTASPAEFNSGPRYQRGRTVRNNFPDTGCARPARAPRPALPRAPRGQRSSGRGPPASRAPAAPRAPAPRPRPGRPAPRG